MAERIRNRLRELMATKGRHEGRRITQRIVAAETGIAKTTIDRYARNEVIRYDEDVLLTLCNYFDCGVGEFLIIEEAEDTPENETPLAIPA